MLKVGSFVKIINSKLCYTQYTDFIKYNRVKCNHCEGVTPNTESVYKVIFIGKHLSNGRNLCIVEDVDTLASFIMENSDKALEVTLPKDCFYLTCPNCEGYHLSEKRDGVFFCLSCNNIFSYENADYKGGIENDN